MSASSRFLVIFRGAALFVEVDADAFAAAKESLAPALSGGMDSDEYAQRCWEVKGQEYSRDGAIAAGLLTEDGDACEGVEIFRAE